MAGERLDIAPVEKKPSGNINRELQVALTEKQLAHCTEDDLKESLKYAFMVVGLRAENIPSGRDKDFLHTYILKNFAGHTPAEIRLAFDMAVQGRLDVDPECYHDNFTIAYFARIMKAYRQWAREEVKQLPPPPEQESTPEWKLHDACVWCHDRQKMIDKPPTRIRDYFKYKNK